MSITVRAVPGQVGWFARLGGLWSLTKSLQTALLLLTAVAGYVSGCCLNLAAAPLLPMMTAMLLAIAGSTVFNMVYDRDIDARMERTASRPLPSGVITVAEAATFGSLLSVSGIVWAFWLLPLYGWLVLAGWVLDVCVYTMLLKRRTPFSILIGGLSGAMPILAGRALATGFIDWTGILLALGVLAWIPLHIVTFSISRQADYDRAGIPTISARYGPTVARWLISASIVLAAAAFLGAAWRLSLPLSATGTLAGFAVLLAVLTLIGLIRPDRLLEQVVYKGASVYMLSVMLVIIAFGI